MLPSPSLGPPLLSASWSPPLSCGMGFAVWAGAMAGGAAGVVTAAWLGGALWCRDELPDGVGAGTGEPDAVSACHSPPNALRPLPVSVPGPVSLTKVYRGCPSKVAWAEPSERLIMPSLPVRPAAAVTGPFTGGQAAAQAPLQSDVVMVSGANEYTAKPWASVSTVTPPIVAVFRLPAVAATGLLVLVLPPLVEDVPDEPHAASTVAAAATTGSASSIRRRFGAFSRVSDLIIAFSFASGPARAPAPGGVPTIPPRNRRCPASDPSASAPAP